MRHLLARSLAALFAALTLLPSLAPARASVAPPPPRREIPYVSQPKGWDTGWKAAQYAAKAGTGTARVALIGDSITMGQNASDQLATSWAALLRANLASRLGLHGDFYPASFSNDWNLYGTAGTAVFRGLSPWTISATGGRAYAVRGAFRALYYGSGQILPGSNPVTFTSIYSCTAMDLIVQDGTTPGSFVYRLDGGEPQTVSVGTSGFFKRVSLSDLPLAVHSVTFDSQSAPNVLVLAGVATYTGSPGGLEFANLAFSGAAAVTSFPLTTTGPNAEAFLQGRVSATVPTGFGFPSAPNLAVIALGVNDCGTGQSVSAYVSVLRRLVQGLRRARPDCSIAFVAFNIPSYTNSDAVSGFSNAANWLDFVTAMRGVAESQRCAFANVNSKWGETAMWQGQIAYGQPFITATDSHPTDAGHADIYNLLKQIY